MDNQLPLEEDFRVTRNELEVLARHYLEHVRDVEFEWAAYQQTGSDSTRRGTFGKRRLGSIERILGEDVLDKALARVEEKWRRKFDDLKVDLATPVKCEQCGEEFYREVAYQVDCMECPCTS